MDQQNLMAKSAWLYHVEGLTQAQIADRLGLTRRRVNEILADALREGVVTVSFNGQFADCVALESNLCDAYGLKDAVVVPTPVDTSQTHAVLGRGAAAYLNRFILAHAPRSIGVGWGSTLRETAQYLSPTNLPDTEIHSMMGGLTHGSEINTFEIVRSFARVLNAQSRYFVAPIYAESATSREAIISQTVFQRMFRDICDVDLAYLSVGDISDRSLQVRYGLPPGVSADELAAKGAVGDLLGRYLSPDGREIDHPINSQVLSPEFEQFRAIRHRMIVGGGDYKIPIIRAVLAAGLATILVTDEINAKALLGKSRDR